MDHNHPVVKKMLEGWALAVALVLVFYAGYGVSMYENELLKGPVQTASVYSAVSALATTSNMQGEESSIVLSVITDKNEYVDGSDVLVNWSANKAPQEGMVAELVDLNNVSLAKFVQIDSKLKDGSFGFVFESKLTAPEAFRIQVRDIATGVTAFSNDFLVMVQELVSIKQVEKPMYVRSQEAGAVATENVAVTFSASFTNNDAAPVYFSKDGNKFVNANFSAGVANSVSVDECDQNVYHSTQYNVLKPGQTIECKITLITQGSGFVSAESFNFQKSMTSISPMMTIKPASLFAMNIRETPIVDRVAVEQTANSLSAAQSLLTASVLPGLAVLAEGVLALLKK